MPKTYAIADLHGRYDLLVLAYCAIVANAKGMPATIVHLGDYVDRGPHSRQIIEFLMNGATVPIWMRRVCLMGNHEEMMHVTLTTGLDPSWWVGNGGGQTLISYEHPVRGEYNPRVVPTEHVEWLDELPKFYADKHRLFVHAGIDPKLELDEQDKQVLLWHSDDKPNPEGYRGRHVVHGHTPSSKNPITTGDRTNFDTGAYSTGRLVVGVFDDAVPGGPVDLLEIKQMSRDRRGEDL